VFCYRIGSDDEGRRHEEQLLPLADVLESDKAALADIHALDSQALLWEAQVYEPPLQRRRALQGLDLAAPRDARDGLLLRGRGSGRR